MNEKKEVYVRRKEDYIFVVFLILFFVLALIFLSYQNIKLLSNANRIVGLDISSSSSLYINIDNANIVLESSEAGLVLENIASGKEDILEDNNANLDTDGDGLSDALELKYGTNKLLVDTDGDTYSDFVEISNNYNPLGDGELPQNLAMINQIEAASPVEIEGSVLGVESKNTEVEEIKEEEEDESIFSKVKSSIGGIFTSAKNFVTSKFENQEVVTSDNVKDFLGLSDEEYETFVASAKREQKGIATSIKFTEKLFRENLTKLLGSEITLTSEEFVWPVPEDEITAGFHDETYPFKNIFEHPAIDIRAKQGTAVGAINSGYVAEVVDSEGSDYSYVVVVHGDNITSVYGHLSRIDVEEGQRVSQGETLGLSGGTPNTKGAGKLTTGPHLHLEIRENAVAVDPLTYLK